LFGVSLIAQHDEAEDEKVVVNIIRWATPEEAGQ